MHVNAKINKLHILIEYTIDAEEVDSILDASLPTGRKGILHTAYNLNKQLYRYWDSCTQS